MPFRQRRWVPSDFAKRRASVGYSATPDQSLTPSYASATGDDMMPDAGYEDTPGYNPPTAVYPQNRTQLPQQGGLLPPVSQGGSGRGMFSIGNAAHGTINLGGILGPRANPSFDPNNPTSGQMPYQTPGFFRRLFGDTGSDLNAAYVQNQNAQTIAQRQHDADWTRRVAWEKERQQAGFDQQWNIQKSNLDMDAARANLASSTALKEREIQQQGMAARDAAERAAREEERYGSDPIIASMLKRSEIENRVGLAGVKPLGSGSFAIRDPHSGELRYFVQEGGSPGGVTMGDDGQLQIAPPVGRRLGEFRTDGGLVPGASNVPPPPPPANPNRLAADEIELLRKAAGATNAPPTNNAPTVPWYKRIQIPFSNPFRIPGTDLNSAMPR